MTNIKDITEQTWKEEVFPEWGSWLTEEIDATEIPAHQVGIWWLGNMSLWLKTEDSTNIGIDLWAGIGKKTHFTPDMPRSHQFARMAGARKIQPNLRLGPIIFNPFKIKTLDAVIVTHFHHDHLDPNVTAALLQNLPEDVLFYGPYYVVQEWLEWGVPENRVRIISPGDCFKVKEVEIKVTDSFDKTVYITDPNVREIIDKEKPDMRLRAVNIVLETKAGTIYDAADSHFSPLFAREGGRFNVDIAILAYGENPIGIQDKMTSIDTLRTAESLKCSVLIPIHWDAWTNTFGDPQEIQRLWKIRKERFNYQFHPFLWLPGGKFIYPAEQDKLEYFYDRGFADRYTDSIDLPDNLIF